MDPVAVAALIALVGVVIAQLVIIWQANTSGRQWRRDQSLQMLRWAAELSVDSDASRAALGVSVLDGLQGSALLDAEDQRILTASLVAGAAPHPSDGDGESRPSIRGPVSTRAQQHAAALLVQRHDRGLAPPPSAAVRELARRHALDAPDNPA
ncbi:MAG: hypothetical protein Q4G43_11800 [Mobilicoccus sp.]|nr:hypothetical protein [Mobilicoccus sp.]